MAHRIRERDEFGSSGTLLFPAAQPMNPAAHLTVVTDHHGQRSVLRLQGELDASNRDRLHSAISSALEKHPQLLVVDLSALASSTALACRSWSGHTNAWPGAGTGSSSPVRSRSSSDCCT